ncbi:DUF4389 domain-containing protein [Nocardioides sp. zg-1228]|uniref:DUF4389 domain-containing protein n=1 Tax=Nocardioides sp. zg-1228 TaxID=2763008 RepID=UPI0016435845|nr:DUF4389 domain-containing protein [Nocardioides sp. zg-1228]MBC2931436.1 DUF4389 domain-containing protein [Nocardioides sp. zg-1228]QSF57050.1 DUF4389 domain-containing protein [Nocardioides sp. zg-1228]
MTTSPEQGDPPVPTSPVPSYPVHSYPVHVDADLDPKLSRGLWLVKWLLAIPHFIVLAFLWIAFGVLSVVAFFAILITGRYPRSIFDLNVGIMRWNWRVGYYATNVLGTDRYPPFRLADVPDYPAHLEIDYPERLSRGLVLVKWWLLAFPHYLVVGIFTGAAAYAVAGADDSTDAVWAGLGLITTLVLIAAVALLFTGRYPRSIFDLLLGLNRWVMRVSAYTSLMTDRYPPFRLDMGGHESTVVDAPGARDGAGASTDPGPAHISRPSSTTPSRWTVAKVLSVVVGSFLVLMSLTLAAGALIVAAVGLAEDDGFLTSPRIDVDSATHAVISQDGRLDMGDVGSDLPDGLVGDVRVSAESVSGTPLFVGVAPTADVRRYLSGVEHATLEDVHDDHAELRTTRGDAPASPPAQETFWAAKASGADATLTWELAGGDWTVVVMNEDGSAGVSARVATGVKVSGLDESAAVVLVLAGLVLLVGIVLVAIGVLTARPRRHRT